MSDYTVAQQPDGTWTVFVTDDGAVLATMPGWPNETQARMAAAAYRPAATRRDWHVEKGRRVYQR